MRRLSGRFARLGLYTAALAFSAGVAHAQIDGPTAAGERERDRTQRPSRRFQLFGFSDEAYSAVKTAGKFQNYTCNFGSLDCGNGWGYDPTAPIYPTFSFIDWAWGTPPSQQAKIVAANPGAAGIVEARGLGYSVMYRDQLNGSDYLLAADGWLGTYISGEQSTADNSCRDHRKDALGSGNPLLPGNDCPSTWGPLGWQGRKPVEAGEYLAAAGTNPATFRFDFWQIGGEPNGTLDRTLGAFQTYGAFSDYAKDDICGTATARTYGRVMRGTPAGARCTAAQIDAAPTKMGYPLGLEVRFDAFAFAIPALQDVTFYQATVVNNSAQVYGAGVDYDSLYIGMMPAAYGNTQLNLLYTRPDLGAIIHSGTCAHQSTTGLGVCNGAVPAADLRAAGVISPALGGSGSDPWVQGTAAIIMLKSPIGDLRNKLFSRPASPFFANASLGTPKIGGIDQAIMDDTITFTHQHYCGFRACARYTAALDYTVNPDQQKRMFGMMASIEPLALGGVGRQIQPSELGGSPAGQLRWHMFRSADWPAAPDVGPGPADFPRTGGFNEWVPGAGGGNGSFDFNNDGIQDTLHYDNCSGKTSGDNSYRNACVGLFSDTMPHTGGADRRFINGYSNTAGVMAVGPITLRAGDTTSFVVAHAAACCGPGAGDSVSIMRKVFATIDHYMNFYLGPEPLPRDSIVAVDVVGGNQTVSRVTLYFTETAERAVDPFIVSQATRFANAGAGTPDDILRKLNPFLVDSLLAYGREFGTDTVVASGDTLSPIGNFDALYIYKSCDGGVTFTNNAGCQPSPATGGLFATLGWLPYAALERNPATGEIENTFTDENVNGGATYTYVLVGASRGVSLALQTGDAIVEVSPGRYACTANCKVQNVEFAPQLLNTLSTAGPNARTVYVPASLASGGTAAQITMATTAGPVPVERIFTTVGSTTPLAGTYTLQFFDSARVVVRDSLDVRGTSRRGTETTVTAYRAGEEFTFVSNKLGGPGLNGATVASATTMSGSGFQIRTVTYRLTGLTAVLVGPEPDNEAVLVTNQLSREATPETFFSSAAFPGFRLGFNESADLAFNSAYGEQFFRNDQRIADLTSPFVKTRQTSTLRTTSAEGGRYVFSWAGQPFGPGEPFKLDLANPEATRAAILNSLSAREVAQTGLTTAEVAASIGAGTGPEDLVAVKLPFSIVNSSFGNRRVEVAMRRRTSNAFLFGTGLDTITVTVPEDIWMPGDALILLEDVAADAPATDLTITFNPYVLGCDPTVSSRVSCNPIALLTTGSSNWITTRVGTQQSVLFNPRLTTASQFRIVVSAQSTPASLSAACAGGDAAACASIRGGLRSVRAVPNPYIVFSNYVDPTNANNATRPMLFTHVPPRGVLRIYTVSGQLVQQLTWVESDLNGTGDLLWNLQSREGNLIAGGLYMFMITGRDANGRELGSHMGKFVVIR